MKRARWLVVPIAVLGLATPAPSTAQEIEEPPKPRVVVAVVDSPTNPYHEFFNQGGPLYGENAPSSVTPDVLDEFGIDEDHIIDLTRTGSFTNDYAADKPRFQAIEPGEPYWFRGTNIIGISFSPVGPRLRPDAGNTHGVGTTAAVLTANPDAIVVSVESPSIDEQTQIPGYATQPAGEEWAFSHPAVDIVSTSYGPPRSTPYGYHLKQGYAGVVERGKLHVGASDNSPALSPTDATSGPWWTIGVAGYEEGASEGRVTSSGSLPDFVADFTQTLPYCKRCVSGTDVVSGTSFSTPRTAGTLSTVILEARRAAGHLRGIITQDVAQPLMVRGGGLELTNWEIRRALEEGAYYPAQSEHSPSGLDQPVNDVAPWLQTGWGAVTPDPARGVVTEALARLGVAGSPTRTKPDGACDFMTANIRARHVWWDQAAQYSDSNGETADPFEYC